MRFRILLLLALASGGCGAGDAPPPAEATRYRIPNTETALWIAVRATGEPRVAGAGAPTIVPAEVRLVREDGTDAGVVNLPKPESEGARSWSGDLAAGTGRCFLFFDVEPVPGRPSSFHGIEVTVTPSLGEGGGVGFRVEGQAWDCIR